MNKTYEDAHLDAVSLFVDAVPDMCDANWRVHSTYELSRDTLVVYQTYQSNRSLSHKLSLLYDEFLLLLLILIFFSLFFHRFLLLGKRINEPNYNFYRLILSENLWHVLGKTNSE